MPREATDVLEAADAYLKERNAILDVIFEDLDLMTHLERYWVACRENDGANNIATMVARGQLFMELQKAHKGHLKRRMADAAERVKSLLRKHPAEKGEKQA